MGQLPYSGRDFDSLKAALFAKVPELAPAWTNMNEGDLGVALLNMVAGVGDMLSFYMDRMSDEVFLSTVLQRENMKRLCALIDYQLSRPVAATTTLRFTLPTAAVSNLLIPKYTQVKTNDGLFFVTKTDATIFTGQTSVDVTGFQGEYQLDVFTGSGQETQLFPLSRPNVAQNFLEVVVGSLRWTEDAADVATALASVYRVQTDEAERGSLLFSRFFGSVPPQNTPILAHTVETRGAAGNVGSGLVTKVVSVVPGGATLTVTNTTIASGGRSRETVEEARIKAPRNLRRLGRVVTLPDYVDAMEAFDGVAKGQALNHNGYVECYAAAEGGARLFLTAPVTPALTATTGGTLAAGTYYVAITAKDAYGETSYWEYAPTTRAVINRYSSATVAATGRITFACPALPAGATAFRVYIGTSPTTMKLAQDNVAGAAAITLNAVPSTALAPTVNTTGVRSTDGTQSLKQEIEAYIEAFRGLCSVFAVFTATYVPIAVTATVTIYNNYIQSDRKGAVQTALTEYFTPGQRAFAEDVNIADLYALVMGIEGVRSVNFSAPTGDTIINDGAIASLGTVTLTMAGGLAG